MKVPQMLLTISVVILAISVLSLAPIVSVKATATDTSVTRLLSTTNPTSGSTFDVALNITGLEIGGIVEIIPDGFAFVSTTHPSNQTYVSGQGQRVVFVVVNETSIKYEVRAPSEGSGTFSGTWYDALNEKEGDIERTDVSVRVAETYTPPLSPTPTPTPTPSPSPPVPGFEAVFALAGLFVVAVRFLFRRRGGEGSE